MKLTTPRAIAAFSLFAIATLTLLSCENGSSENYDTPPSANYPTAAAPLAPAPHPTYQAAAYEDGTTQPGIPSVPTAPVDPTGAAAPTAPAMPAIPMNPPNAAGNREHYVGPGDSLWKISRTYKIPVESIKQANGMTNDTVVLGKKIIIPAQ